MASQPLPAFQLHSPPYIGRVYNYFIIVHVHNYVPYLFSLITYVVPKDYMYYLLAKLHPTHLYHLLKNLKNH